MVTLDYKLSTDWNPHELDLRTADELTLRYDAFPGDVVFRIDDADFSAQWGWVPVLDFALALGTICDRLDGHDREAFEFTESGATIDFRRDSGLIEITTSYVMAVARTPLFELTNAVDEFLELLTGALETQHPELAENDDFVVLTQA
jgi:hypothetical protein